MTIREFYEAIGGSYDEALHIMKKEERMKSYVGYFLQDDSFAALSAAMATEQYEAAFRAAHTLKGVSGNMGFAKLAAAARELTEELRDGKNYPGAVELFPKVEQYYHMTVDQIKAYQVNAE